MAEILIEALGSKNQHDELRDFQSRFDREFDPMQASSKIIDIHSTAKEPTNHYPELLKDLLDCIPYIEPFGGDVKDRNQSKISRFYEANGQIKLPCPPVSLLNTVSRLHGGIIHIQFKICPDFHY